jgi:hypothetical protein
MRVSVLGTGESLDLGNARLVVAGFTARDAKSVAQHIAELESIGVQAPDTVPMFYELDITLLTTDPTIAVAGHSTSGEGEPVLIRSGRSLYLGVGSDHTDRALERVSVRSAKAACSKPLSGTVVPLDPPALDWDGIHLSCHVDAALYQSGPVAQLLGPADLLGRWTATAGDDSGDVVMFMGTVPLLRSTFVYGARWTVSLELPGEVLLTHTYSAEAA